MKKLSTTFLAFGMIFLLAGSVHAQAIRNAAERGANHNQIQRDKATLQRDQQELAQFIGLRDGLGQAVQNGNVAVAKGYQTKLVNAMQREIEQGEAKIRLGSGEVKQSASEVRNERRDVRDTRGTGRPLQAADDRRDLRDDKGDLRDDKGDLAEAKYRTQRQREILATFQGIQVNGLSDVNALWAKKNLLDEFETTMRRDMAENVEELQEDKGEMREDRRETREDRRQR